MRMRARRSVGSLRRQDERRRPLATRARSLRIRGRKAISPGRAASSRRDPGGHDGRIADQFATQRAATSSQGDFHRRTLTWLAVGALITLSVMSIRGLA